MVSRTAKMVKPTVRLPTIRRVPRRERWPKRFRPSLSSCPSCAITVEDASTPVASAIATGKANSMAQRAGRSGCPLPADDLTGSALTPPINTTMIKTIKATTKRPKRLRVECPGQLRQTARKREHKSCGFWSLYSAFIPSANLLFPLRSQCLAVTV